MSYAKTITKALQEFGQLTGAELAEITGIDKDLVHATTQRMRIQLRSMPKRIHITAWTNDDENGRSYPRPVYALGDKPDAAKPKSNPKKTKMAYEARQKVKVNSVWMLGWTRDQRREHGKRI